MGRKWANIVAKKTAKDGANSKIYAKFGVEIYVAAKQGEPDPESNSALKFVLERAKQAQVPKHVIDKAHKLLRLCCQVKKLKLSRNPPKRTLLNDNHSK